MTNAIEHTEKLANHINTADVSMFLERERLLQTKLKSRDFPEQEEQLIDPDNTTNMLGNCNG